jgi:hypothetical protein
MCCTNLGKIARLPKALFADPHDWGLHDFAEAEDEQNVSFGAREHMLKDTAYSSAGVEKHC